MELLGRPASCKTCGSTFLMPRNLRLACPSCREVVRVPPGQLDHWVSCKFCQHSFRAGIADAVLLTAADRLAAVMGRSGSEPAGLADDGVDRSYCAPAAQIVEVDAGRQSVGAQPDRAVPPCEVQGRADALRTASSESGVRAGRDRRETEGRDAAVARADQFRAACEEHRRLLDEAVAGHRAELEELIRRHTGERSRWEEEQLALEARHREECEVLRRSLEDEVQVERERLDALGCRFERERKALLEQSEQLLHELELSHRDHTAALLKIDELGLESSRLADWVAAKDAAHLEQLERLRGENDLRHRGHEQALHRIDELERQGSRLADELVRQEEKHREEIRRLLQEFEQSREERERALLREQELERELGRQVGDREREADRHRGEIEELLRKIEVICGELDLAQQQVASARREWEHAIEERDAGVGQLRWEIETGRTELEVARRRIEEVECERDRSDVERRAEVNQLHEQMGRLGSDLEAALAAQHEAHRRLDALAAERVRLQAERDRSEEESQAAGQRFRDERDHLIQQLGHAREEAAQHECRIEALSMQLQQLTSELDGLRDTYEFELRKAREQLHIAPRHRESAATDRPRAGAATAWAGVGDRAPSAPDVAQTTTSGPLPPQQEAADYRDMVLGKWDSEGFRRFLKQRRRVEPASPGV